MLTTDQKGAIAEAEITAAAIQLGVGVYRPTFEGGRSDLIFEIEQCLIRGQCKWAVCQGGGDCCALLLVPTRSWPNGRQEVLPG
jgi:PD-(D/E)XK endonuclease